MSISRNDPCPCGSGKKFKKCCIDMPGINELKSLFSVTKKNKKKLSTFDKFVSSHSTGDLLNIITALQTIPQNYGKNVRMEIMAKKIIQAMNDGKSASLGDFRKIVSKEFPAHHLEDLPENSFTENVVFFGGNYVVMPGITSNGAEIFRTLIESIFIFPNKLPEKFKGVAHSAMMWILELSKSIFERAGLTRYLFEEDDENEIRFPEAIVDYSFSSDDLTAIAQKFKVSQSILKDFVLDPNDEGLNDDDPDNNPMIRKPLFAHNSRLYFALPSVQLTALNEYVLNKAQEFDCEADLLDTYNKRLRMEMQQRLAKMGWLNTDIQLPENKEHHNLKELVCRIDDNKLAYVCYVGAQSSGRHSGVGHTYFEQQPNTPDFNVRLKDVIDHLKTKEGLEDYEFLTLVIVADVGRNIMFMVDKPQAKEDRIWFSIFEFLRLAVHEKWDMLSVWRFAKVYRITSENAFIQATSTLDAYWAYKENDESFYNSDDARLNFLAIVPGSGSEITREAIKKEDLHGALVELDGTYGHCYVKRAFEPAPVYKPVDNVPGVRRLLECFRFPLWVINEQVGSEVNSDSPLNFISAVAFWLYKLSPHLTQYNLLGESPFYFKIIIDDDFLKHKTSADLPADVPIPFTYTIADRCITFNVPFSLSRILFSPDNSGERLMMENVLRAFNLNEEINLTDEEITSAINDAVPLGPAKMILSMDTGSDIRIDPRWLLSNRYVSDAEVSLILDELASFVKTPNPIPAKITGKDNKVNLCNAIVTGLILKLRKMLAEYDSVLLVKRFILIHEGYVQEREYQKIHIPAKIACFSDIDEQVQQILKKNKQLVNSTLSIRCLIEFIVAEPKLTGKQPNFADTDQMMAMMNEIIEWGFMSDAIYLDLDDPEIGLLPSGRIGSSKDFYHEKLKPFGKERAITEVESYVNAFKSKFKKRTTQAESSREDFHKRTDAAFKADWGITLDGILGICELITALAEQNKTSVYEMESQQLLKYIQSKTTLSEEEIKCGLDQLSLKRRPDFNKPPQGYNKNDIYPWKYNREFAFLRRPLLLITNSSGEEVFYWGLRNTYAAGGQILSLLYSGRLRTYNHSNIDSILAEINSNNGDDFREDVKEWFKNQEDFITIDHEVSIQPKGHIDAEKNYGDIDVFVINHTDKIIYSVECKDTEQAKNVHEMKGELDKYLGKKEGEGLILKHVERAKFIQQHKDRLSGFIDKPEDYTIISFILTSEDLPLAYIEDKLLLPFISFPKLKRNGVELLKTLVKN